MSSSFIQLQKETIEKALSLLKSYPEVEAIFISGSHSKGEESSFSDIDIACVFEDKSRPKKDEIYKKVSEFYPTLSHLWLYDKNGLFLYENGVRLDLDLLNEDMLDDINFSKIKILYDPKNKYTEKVNTINKNASKPQWRDPEGDMIDWFFWMFRQAYCYTKRAETNSERSFNKLYSAQSSLKLIRDRLIDMKIYMNGKWDYMNNIDEVLADNLASTFSDLNPNNMKDSTRKLLDIFENVGQEYCQKEEKEFPHDKVVKIKTLFDEFDKIKV
jgi:predicted nucleotidyltransferase